MNAFIFQSTVERYDLRTMLKAGAKESWLASRYQHAMRPGDIVYFWLAGPESIRGVYGWGKITSKPRGTNEVGVHVEVVFPSPLLATDIRRDRVLAGLLIFKVPQATNFLLSRAEAARLAALVKRSGERAPEQRQYSSRPSSPLTKRREQIFISYSHRDRDWLERLQVHLAPLTKAHGHVLWDDTKIAAGEKWRASIGRAMASAKVAVLLVSADFLASDFIMENELPTLLAAAADQGAVILPVITAPCRFRETQSLAQFQAVNPPSKPLSAMSGHEREETFYQVSVAVEGALETAKQGHD